jgi:hypothetical protein
MSLRKRKAWLAETKKSWLEKFKEQHGIVSKKAHPSHQVHSIGYSDKEKKYWGWSHRAAAGFKIGDRIFEPGYGDDKTPFTKHGKKPIKNMADAEKAAKAFARYVS